MGVPTTNLHHTCEDLMGFVLEDKSPRKTGLERCLKPSQRSHQNYLPDKGGLEGEIRHVADPS